MKRFLIASITVILFFTLPFNSAGGEFKVTKVYDGDTVKAEGHDITIKIRLVGIDALTSISPRCSENRQSPRS